MKMILYVFFNKNQNDCLSSEIITILGEPINESEVFLGFPVLGSVDEIVTKCMFFLSKNNSQDSFPCGFFLGRNSNEFNAEDLKKIQDFILENGSQFIMDSYSFFRMSDPNFFDFRFLGRLFFDGCKEFLPVFDFFQKELSESGRKKAETRTFFEDSVFDFCFCNYQRAVVGFSNVLKIFPDDKASLVFHRKAIDFLNNKQF